MEVLVTRWRSFSPTEHALADANWKEAGLFLALLRSSVNLTKHIEGNIYIEGLKRLRDALWEAFIAMQVLDDRLSRALVEHPEMKEDTTMPEFETCVGYRKAKLTDYWNMMMEETP